MVITLITTTQAHSWVEIIRNIAGDGSFVGDAGYPRGWQNRSLPNFSDLPQTWQVENLHGSDPNLCAPGEQDSNSQGSIPRLQTTPGSPIALLYQENGHVTIPSNNPAKPANRGTVYIYATQKPKAGEKYYDVYQKWNVAGTGGDGRGKLISTQNFDDGRCFQINNGDISKARQAANKFTPSAPMGSNLWCQNNIVIPHDVDTSKLLTLYWVWKWDDLPHVDRKVWDGQNQTYTSCMDIKLAPPSGGKAIRKFAYAGGQSPQDAALGNVFNKLATGNVFAVSAYIDGMSPTPSGALSSATYSTVAPSLNTPAAQASISKSASGSCHKAVSTKMSTETIFVYGSSTGTIAPTGTGLSFSTKGVSVAVTSPSHVSQAQASQTAANSASITGVLVTQISDGQPEAAAPTPAISSQVSQASDGQPQASAATSNAATLVSQISDGQPQASAPTSASAAAATSTIGDNPVVVPVPTNPTASFTFEPSITQTATPILSSSAPYSNGTTVEATSAVTAGAPSLASSAPATTAAPSTIASSSAGSSIKTCKSGAAKRQSKIFASAGPAQGNLSKARQDSINRAHPRHFIEN